MAHLFALHTPEGIKELGEAYTYQMERGKSYRGETREDIEKAFRCLAKCYAICTHLNKTKLLEKAAEAINEY